MVFNSFIHGTGLPRFLYGTLEVVYSTILRQSHAGLTKLRGMASRTHIWQTGLDNAFLMVYKPSTSDKHLEGFLMISLVYMSNVAIHI